MIPAPELHTAPAPVAFVTDAQLAHALARQLAPLPLDGHQCCRVLAEWIVAVAPDVAAARPDLDAVTVARRLLRIGEAAAEYVLALRMQTHGSA